MRMRPSATLPALLALVALSASLAGCSSSDPSDTATDPAGTRPTREATGAACTFESDGRPAAKKVDLPPDRADVSGKVPATISTSAGEISLTLDAEAAPCTATSFASLADQGFFDDTTCHRLTTQGIYVLQCGDPTATGSGGPGYAFADELSGKETYGPATVAMANAGPDTNGSQFFLVYGDSPLPPAYTVFGTMDKAGLEVVKEIADAGTADGGPDGAPKEDVRISSVTVE
jgi:peptidyl-prolyl cis-trans isomerase B (cyclophilin B)